MTTVAVCNGAGSAGKTTTAVTVSTLNAQAGHKTLLVDLDPQANATSACGVEPVVGHTISEALLRQLELREVVIEAPQVPGLWVAPATDTLDAVSVDLARQPTGVMRLKQILREAGEYDTVLIDCPGTTGWAVVAALIAADKVVAVTRTTLKELEGLPRLEGLVLEVSEAYHDGELGIDVIVPCEVPPASAGKLYTEGLDLLRQSYGDLVTPTVRRAVQVPSSYAAQTPLPVLAPKEPVTHDYRDVLADLVARGLMP